MKEPCHYFWGFTRSHTRVSEKLNDYVIMGQGGGEC